MSFLLRSAAVNNMTLQVGKMRKMRDQFEAVVRSSASPRETVADIKAIANEIEVKLPFDAKHSDIKTIVRDDWLTVQGTARCTEDSRDREEWYGDP